jgi:predicted nucleotidyltransferase component of viral defense system
MESSSEKLLNFGILGAQTQKALEFFSTQKWLASDGWYLAGGTALALQANNRKSFDLDFFNQRRNVGTGEILNKLIETNEWKINFTEINTVYGELFGAKVSFIAYPFFVPDKEFVKYGAIDILSARDVAVMKIIAVSQRGRKRDFFDLYWCANNIEPLEETIKRLKKQYPMVAHDYHHILKSLVYFDDAEGDPDPELNFKVNWLEVKSYFEAEVPQILKKIMELK